MNPKDIIIICNPMAGGGLALKRLEKFKKILEAKKFLPQIELTTERNHATEIAEEYIKHGIKRIVSFGGDGTMNEILQSIGRAEHTYKGDLVYLGAGSSNDFEKKFPHKTEWIERIVKDNSIAVDLCQVECTGFDGLPLKRYFINNSSIGIISVAGEMFNNVQGLTKKLKQVNVDVVALISGLKALARFDFLHGDFLIDGDQQKKIFSNLTVYKTPHFGGGMYFGRGPEQDDGKLSVAMIEPLSKKKLIGMIPSLYKGTVFEREDAHYQECSRLELKSDHNVVVETDGEIIGYPPAVFSIMKQAVRVAV